MKKELWCVKLSFILVVFFGACRQPEGVLYRIPVKEVLDHPVVVEQKDWIDSIRYIPLETTDSCYVGEVYKIVACNNHYYVRDLSGNLFVFTADGKFVRKVGKTGRGPEEYVYLCDFAVDSENGDVYVVSLGEMVVYDAEGRFLRKRKIDEDFQVVTFDAAGRLVFITPVCPDIQAPLLVVCDKEGQIQHQYPGTASECCWLGYFNWLQEQNERVYYKEEFSDTLCYLDDRLDVHPYALVDLGVYKFEASHFSNTMREQWTKYYRLDGAFDFEHTLVLNVQKGLRGKELSVCFFNKTTGEACLGRKEDGYNGFSMNGVCYCPRTVSGNRLICSLSASNLWENEDIQDAQLRDIAGQVNENSNPVLAVCVMK